MSEHKQWFLTLDDAVLVARRFADYGYDEDFLRGEFFQKCFISNYQYDIGFADGVEKAIEKIKELYE